MAYKIEQINDCTKKLVFDFPNLDLTEQIKTAIRLKQKETNLKGFRKGKAPLEMVQKMFGSQIESDALNAYIQQEFFNAIRSEDLKVVGYPTFENMNYVAGEKVSFDAMVEVFPEFEVGEIGKLAFTKEKVEVTEEDVQKVRQNYLSSKSELISLEDANTTLEKGHSAVINFQGIKEDGERPEAMKGNEYVLEIGSGQFIPGFEDQLVGMKKNEKREIVVTFPSEYQVADLQNAQVKFEVELLEIKEKKFPEFTDDLAKEFQYESVTDFEEKTKKNLYYQKQRQAKEKLHQQVLEKLVELHQFDIPMVMVDQQKKHLREELANSLKYQGFNESMTEEYFSKWSDDLQKKAEFQVRSGLILDKLANTYGIETSEEDFEKKIEETADHSGMNVEQIRKYYSEKNIKNNLMFAIREEKTFEKLIASLNVTEL